jgi:hypothetical protein
MEAVSRVAKRAVELHFDLRSRKFLVSAHQVTRVAIETLIGLAIIYAALDG